MKWFVLCLCLWGVGLAQEITVCPEARKGKWIVPGQEGWLIAPEDVKVPLMIDKIAPYLQRLNDTLESQGTTLIMLVNPRRLYVYDQYLDRNEARVADFDAEAARVAYRKIIEDLNALGILAPDMLTVAQSLPAGESYFFKRDHHWTPAGARAAARALADLIKAQTAYAELEKMEFITSVVGEAAYTGGWGAEVEAHCSTELPSEKMIVYETEATTQIGLFDELPPAEVVLVGTSFSQPAREPGFNFEGFLKEHLSLDVLNMAVPGGGMFASIYSYFPSHEFQEHKPRFLIWELSVQSSKVFFDEGVYRQIIASLYGSCQGLLEESAELQPRLELLANDDNLNIQGDDYYILLEFSDITLVNFEVTLLAHNGKSESLMIERSTRVINNGRFALELSNKGQYKQTILSLPENAQGIVHARLCRSG